MHAPVVKNRNQSVALRPIGPSPVDTKPASEVSLRSWIAVLASTLGAFMAVLNIQITNAALPNIQGAIGAGIDDGGWISTAYLITEIVVIPLTGWLSRVFSTRTYLLVNSTLFLVFSAGCAFTHDLSQMIIMRGLQGFTGGVLIPMAFTIIMTKLPQAKQPIGMALFAVSATFAPAIGPTIGGYLNDNYGWQFIFYVNLLPGIPMLGMLFLSLDREPMNLPLLKHGDWPGIITMAIGLASLQTVLEDGNKDDWFGSPYIVRLAIIACVALLLFLWIEFRTKEPLLNLRLLCRRNFGFGTAANFFLGMALYGSVFILPLYLSIIQNYDAEQIGMVLAWVGIPQLVLIPLVPGLMKRIDARLLVAFGFILFAASNFMCVHLDKDFAGPQFFWANIVRAIGQAVVLAPLSAIATSGIEKQSAGSASALFNMTRNLGGAVGIALLQTFNTKREQFHSNILDGSVSLLNEQTRNHLQHLTNYFTTHGMVDKAYATHTAIVALGRGIRQQAAIMGYSDTFFLIGVFLIIAVIATLCLKKPDKLQSGAGH